MTRKTVSKVLAYREFTREQIEAELQKTRERLALEEAKLNDLENRFDQAGNEFERKQSRGQITVHDIELFATYCTHLNGQIKQQQCMVSKWTAELEAGALAVTAAYREHQVVQKLHGRIVVAEGKETDRTEQKRADERFLARRGK